jgi:hypothetical protein
MLPNFCNPFKLTILQKALLTNFMVYDINLWDCNVLRDGFCSSIRMVNFMQTLHTNVILLICAVLAWDSYMHTWLSMEKEWKIISYKLYVTAGNYQRSGTSEVRTKAGSFTGHANDLLSLQVHCTTCAWSVALLCSKWRPCQLSFALRSSPWQPGILL